MKKMTLFILATMITFLLTPSQAISGCVTKSISKSVGKRMSIILKRDRIRDAVLKAKPLARNKTVFKYGCNKNQLTKGVKSGEHTTRATAGRPLSAEAAKKEYGLRRKPGWRVTYVIPKGTPVKTGKVIGGAPGKVEYIPQKNISKAEKVIELQ